jgi:hypothetical protein
MKPATPLGVAGFGWLAVYQRAAEENSTAYGPLLRAR